ncbi:MAG: stage II sporulation protein M [Flavobacteriia bacterium]|nr:stage II sporulation protein M [Flavobacteriia bacterium]
MKESQFIKENSERWKPLEDSVRSLKKPGKSRKLNKELGEDYIRVTDDLGYAQTFYRRRSIRVYLNNITSSVYRIIRLNRERDKNPIFNFFMKEVPSIIYHGRKYFFISLIVFVVAMIIGAFSLEQDTGFANHILGNGYVNMTETNIEDGDPMRVYKDMDSEQMFMRIAVNNLRVVALSFIVGLLFGLGTLSILVSNGIMLGVFQYFFYKKGLLLTSFLTIWQHGTIEISCIIIGGGAGLMLGSGYLFPGNYSRLLSLRLQFYRGMKIILAIAPLIVVAAWIESYITRHDDMDQIFRLFFILLNAALIIGYFFVLPWRVGRRLDRVEGRPSNENIAVVPSIREGEILNLGEIFQLALKHVPNWLTKQIWLPILGGAIGLVAVILMEDSYTDHVLSNRGMGLIMYDFFGGVFNAVENFNLIISYFNGTIGFVFSGLLLVLLSVIQILQAKEHFGKRPLLSSMWVLLTNTVLLAILFGLTHQSEWFSLLLFPGILLSNLTVSASFKFNINPIKALGRALRSFGVSTLKILGWSVLMYLSTLLLLILIQSSFLGFILYFIETLTADGMLSSYAFLRYMQVFLVLTVFLFVMAITQAGSSYLLNTLHEQLTSENLRAQIASIPPRKKRYGIDEAL